MTERRDGEEQDRRSAPIVCDNCYKLAGFVVVMRRAYHRMQGKWETLGWWCPNCWAFIPDDVLKIAREIPKFKKEYQGEVPIDERDFTGVTSKQMSVVKRLLQTIYRQ